MIDTSSRRRAVLAVLACASLAACGGKEPATPSGATPAAGAAADSASTAPPPGASPSDAAATPARPLPRTADTWSPEALEELLAPVALYPDVILLQVLVASTNPQEVLDAGNWLVANPELEGRARDAAATQAGFTPPVRALVQSPQVIDQMCLNMGWTEEVGQAYVNDQAGVMDAVQRLRAQAQSVGTLQTTSKMKVETSAATSTAPAVIKIESPSPQVVYVPQYDPVAAYAPPATATTASSPTTSNTEGHSTGTLITTGVLAFGAGILMAEIIDDDDDRYYGSYGNMWYGPPPYYPPYPYRPVYGNGFYPSHGYNRPNHWGDNNLVVINNGGNGYWDRWDGNGYHGNHGGVGSQRPREPRSPITQARPARPELAKLNSAAAKGPSRPAPNAQDAWKGKSTYAGANRPTTRDVPGAGGGGGTLAKDVARPSPGAGDRARPTPKVQGTYAGARPVTRDRVAPSAASDRMARPQPRPAPRPADVDRGRLPDYSARVPTRDVRPNVQRPSPGADRMARPAPSPGIDRMQRPPPRADRMPRPAGTDRMARPSRPSAMSGANRGSADRAAAARGRQSARGAVPVQSRRPQSAARSAPAVARQAR